MAINSWRRVRLYNYLKEAMSDDEALQIFGISREALSNKALVKKRFRDLAKMYHPDKIGKKSMIGIRHFYQDDSIEPEDMMVKVNLAYEKIKKMKPERLSAKAAQNLMQDLSAMFGGKKPDWANLDPKKGVYA
jgi:curved DNA-binding protein CbpA